MNWRRHSEIQLQLSVALENPPHASTGSLESEACTVLHAVKAMSSSSSRLDAKARRQLLGRDQVTHLSSLMEVALDL